MGTFLVPLLMLYCSSYLSILVSIWLLSSALFPVVLRTSRFLPILLHTLVLVQSHLSIRTHIFIHEVPRCESVRVASIWPTCDLPFPIAFAIRVSQEQSFEISTPRYIYWSTVGRSSSPQLYLKITGFSLSSLRTTTALFFMFAVTLHFLVYSSSFSISVPAVLWVFPIPPRIHLQTLSPISYLPPS